MLFPGSKPLNMKLLSVKVGLEVAGMWKGLLWSSDAIGCHPKPPGRVSTTGRFICRGHTGQLAETAAGSPHISIFSSRRVIARQRLSLPAGEWDGISTSARGGRSIDDEGTSSKDRRCFSTSRVIGLAKPIWNSFFPAGPLLDMTRPSGRVDSIRHKGEEVATGYWGAEEGGCGATR